MVGCRGLPVKATDDAAAGCDRYPWRPLPLATTMRQRGRQRGRLLKAAVEVCLLKQPMTRLLDATVTPGDRYPWRLLTVIACNRYSCACAPIDNKKGCGLSGLAQKGLPRGEKRGFHPLLPSFGGGRPPKLASLLIETRTQAL